MKIAALAISFLLVGQQSVPKFVPTIVFVRKVVLDSQPEAKRCDALNWPLDDDACRNLETAIGQTVMRHAKRESNVKADAGAGK